MAMGGPEGPQNAGGGWLGSLASTFTNTLSGLFGGMTAEATEGESYLDSVGARHHHPIDTRSVTEVGLKPYGVLKEELMEALEASREDETKGDPEKLDVIRRGALETCKGCLKRDDMNELLRNHRNFPELFADFPLDALLDKWREEKGIDPDQPDTEVFPERYEDWKEFKCPIPTRNLNQVGDQFRELYREFMNDTEEFEAADGLQGSANKPNTKVFTTRRALSCLANEDVKGFIDLYQTSHWLNATLPAEFLAPLADLSSKNLELDTEIKAACKPLRQSYMYECRDMPLSSAAMMQKNQETLFALRDDIKAEIQAARDVSPHRSDTSSAALEALKEGRWHDLVNSMRNNPTLKKEPLAEAERLKTTEDHLGYVNMIALARILTTYKSCLTRDTTEEFLHECVPFDVSIPDVQNHWAFKMRRGEYDIRMELFEALKDKKQKAAIENALRKHMPELISGNPLA